MPQQSEGVNLEHLLGALRRRGWVLGVCILLSAGVAYALARHENKRYTASAALAFTSDPLSQQISGVAPSAANAGSVLAQQATDVELVRLGDTAAKTAAAIGHGLNAREVAHSLEIAPAGESGVVTLTATAGSASLASAIADTYGRVFVSEQQASRSAYLASALRSVHRQLGRLSHSQQVGPDGLALQTRIQTLNL